jgi:hypothetical protein
MTSLRDGSDVVRSFAVISSPASIILLGNESDARRHDEGTCALVHALRMRRWLRANREDQRRIRALTFVEDPERGLDQVGDPVREAN